MSGISALKERPHGALWPYFCCVKTRWGSATCSPEGRPHTVNNAALDTVCKCLLEALLSILWGIYPGVELLSGMKTLFLTL